MRTLRIVGLVAAVAWTAAMSGCGSDDDDTTGSAGLGGSGGASGSAGSAGTPNGDSGSPSNGNAGDGNAGTGNAGDGNAGDANAGTGGANDSVPYANVVAVTATGSDDAYTFDVSVESADIDCTQFANWWEVLTEDGALSYRRILEHSHTDANGTSDADASGNTFTRSGGPVPVGADTIVIVRAHMSTGGYNGAVMRGSVAEGFIQALDIDGDFATDVEDDAPQPTGCEF